MRGAPIRVSICHCHACQRRTGSVFGAQARFAVDDVTVAGEYSVYQRQGDAGGVIDFKFCPACGATVCYQLDSAPEMIAIPVGAFADANFPKPDFSVYEERMHPWVTLPEPMQHRD